MPLSSPIYLGNSRCKLIVSSLLSPHQSWVGITETTSKSHQRKFVPTLPSSRLRAKKGPAPPLGNFAGISYLEENFKPHLLRDACTLCSGALVSDSLLHMLLYYIPAMKYIWYNYFLDSKIQNLVSRYSGDIFPYHHPPCFTQLTR